MASSYRDSIIYSVTGIFNGIITRPVEVVTKGGRS
jgi:hypothetical protein